MELGGRAIRVRRLGGTRAGEIRLTRFPRNGAVSVEEMMAEAAQRTSERSQGRDVLAIQDTTAVRSDGGGGDCLHAVLAVDALDGSILGLVDGQVLERTAGRRAGRRGAMVEEKQSFRWLQGADQAATVCAGAERVTAVADRESDIHEAFALRPEGAELLIRAAQDRCLADSGRLFAALDALPETGRAPRRSRCGLPPQPWPGPRAATAPGWPRASWCRRPTCASRRRRPTSRPCIGGC